jgi:hypothetical protein
MEFYGDPPGLLGMMMADIGWRIFGEGEIELDSGEKLQRFLAENNVPLCSRLSLHSGGGSLIGGMNLGRVIRDHRLHVMVGRRGRRTEYYTETEPGYCMSAAALAFLGGEFRWVGEKNQFGVHRFTLGEYGEKAFNTAQTLSATIIEYIRSMDVNTELFTIASEVDASDILALPESTLQRLNVVNNGITAVKWSIESLDEALYLRGSQDTMFGSNKFLIVFPPNRNPYIHIIFTGGANADSVMQMPTDRLEIDGEYFDMEELRIDRTNSDGMINAMYKIDESMMNRLARATKVGMLFQWTSEAPIFFGFSAMPFEDGAKKLQGLLGLYRRLSQNN